MMAYQEKDGDLCFGAFFVEREASIHFSRYTAGDDLKDLDTESYEL